MAFQGFRNVLGKGIKKLGDADSSLVSLATPLTSTASWVNKKKYLPAAAQTLTGTYGAVATDAAQRAAKTAARAKSRGINPVFGATRGFYTGLKQNRANMLNSATMGGVVVANNANSLVKKSPIGNTKLGKMLTTDISTPLVTKLQPRQKLRYATGGLFSKNYCFVSDFSR